MFTFTMTAQDPLLPVVLTTTAPNGGPTKWQLGTDGADIRATTNVDDIVRGSGGDDTFDLTGTARDLVEAETDPAINGTDAVTGFTLGPATDVTDALLFSGPDVASLRRSRPDVEISGLESALGANSGFVGVNTQPPGLGLGTLTSAAGGPVDARSGGEIYLMVTDPTTACPAMSDPDAFDVPLTA
ncbi:hypothetical protein [Ruegeria intermedia]|uniref:hypothetical protein n=1 Tax=Ruegeria intermedia TaxID=996115 RepID=UPI00122CA15C|nr:hypothetical protein [Ruegeria intermedia]